MPPDHDPLTSSVAKNFEKSKKVEGLLNRLANYMAGEIPDTADLADMFKKSPRGSPNATMTDNIDDGSTQYSKDEQPLQRLKSYP